MTNMTNITDTINMFAPEIILLLTIIVNYILGQIHKEISHKIFKWFCASALTLATISIFLTQTGMDYHYFWQNAFVTNIYTAFIKFIILFSFFLIMLYSRNTIKQQKDNAPHYCNALIIATLGALFLVSANNLISIFSSLLVTTLGGILISKYSQYEKITIKYTLVSFLSLITYIIGGIHLYAQFQEINLEALSQLLDVYNTNFPFIFSSTLIISSLCFQIFAFPFISWKNHICKSLSYPALTFLSVVPMIAGFSVLSRTMVFLFGAFDILKILIAIISIFSIFLGLITGIKKDNLKEIITSNTSIQSGLMLLGLSCFSVYSLSGVIFYLFCYSITMIGLGASLTIMNKPNLISYKGLIYTRPYYALATTISFLTLAGLAPTCGFISKIYLLSAITRSTNIFMIFLIIALFLMIGTILFYFKFASITFIKPNEPYENLNLDKFGKTILYICILLNLLIMIFAEKIIEICKNIAYYI